MVHRSVFDSWKVDETGSGIEAEKGRVAWRSTGTTEPHEVTTLLTPQPTPALNLTPAIYRYSAALFGVYLFASLFAFWPRYFSNPAGVAHVSVHVHGALMGLWLVALFTQGLLIRTDRRALHRRIGATSFVLAPALAISIVFVAHVSANRTELTDTRLAQLALQLGYVPVFLGIYILAMRNRDDPPRHARFMLCTVLPMTSPVFDRVVGFYAMPELAFLPSFPDGSRMLPVIYLILVPLALWDWRTSRRVDVFPIVGVVFAAQHAFTLLAYHSTWWRSFGEWFVTLPLT